MALNGRVAIVTGAGNGLGRAHAIALASQGASVLVNDVGCSLSGNGDSCNNADTTVELIERFGGNAIANYANVCDMDATQDMVSTCLSQWGKVDILVNNAGILRDKSFGKMAIQDFRDVFEVHVMGAVNCTKAVWDCMRQNSFGRVVFTTSSSGLYGNFGQSNYAAAKMALVGLMNSLAMEGKKYNIHVNCLAPAAATRMTESILTDINIQKLLDVEKVSEVLIALCTEQAPTKTVFAAGAGAHSQTIILDTPATPFTGNIAPLPKELPSDLTQYPDGNSQIAALVQAAQSTNES